MGRVHVPAGVKGGAVVHDAAVAAVCIPRSSEAPAEQTVGGVTEAEVEYYTGCEGSGAVEKGCDGKSNRNGRRSGE